MALCFAYLLSAILIIAAARGDLWLDEIWSLSIARASKTPMEVLTRFHHDNNHILNTLFLKLVGDQQRLFVYRLLAVFSGIGAIFLVGLLARDWGSLEALFCVLLTGTSYPLVLYFSEARGYAPAILFALLSYTLLHRNRQDFRIYRVPLFWTASILGIIAHLSFVIVSTALLLVSLAYEIRMDGSLRRRLTRFLAYHVPPFAFFAWFYIFFVRDMVVGGGPVYTKWDVIKQASALLLGFPEEPPFQAMAVVGLVVLLAIGMYTLRRNGDEQWLFYLTVLFLTPTMMLILARPQYLYFRYLIVCFPFFYMLLSYLFGNWYRSWPKRRRLWGIVAMALLIGGQTPRLYGLLTFRRGNYTAALARVSKDSPEGILRIGSDHDFRNRLLLEFYASFLPDRQTLRYVPQSNWHQETPDWLLIHSQDLSYQPAADIAVPMVGVYRFIEAYKFSGVSGWSWFLFRREGTHR